MGKEAAEDLAGLAGCPCRARRQDQGAVQGGLTPGQVIMGTSPDSKVGIVERAVKWFITLKLEGVGFR